MQWKEIRSGSTDTHTLAEAAKKQADKAETISGSIRRAVTAMETSNTQAKESLDKTLSQSKAALDATIAASRLDQRAWVAEVAVVMDAPEIGKPVHATVQWKNTGKTFAKQVYPSCHFRFAPEQFTTEVDLMRTVVDSRDYGSIGVLAPSSDYKTALSTAAVAEPDVPLITTTWYTYIWGEVRYYDIFRRHHTTIFCAWRHGTSGEFFQCPFHNNAD